MNHSFKNRIAITTGIIFFVSLTVITIVNITNSKKNLQKRLIEHEFPALLENIISEVDEQLMKVASGLQIVAEDPPIQDWLLAGEPEEFVPSVVERLVLNTKRFKTMGSNLISWNTKNYYNYANNNFKLIKITEADTWFPAFKNSGHDVAINAYTNHAAMGEVAFMNVRIDNNGNFLGIISVAIDLSDFVNNVKNKKIGEQGLNMMISPNGIVVLHEEKSKIQEYNLNDDPGYKSHMELITSNNEYNFEYTNEKGDIRYVNTVYIPELDWYLISEASRDELFADIDKSTIQIIVLSVVFLFIGIILLLLISNYLVKSLKTVTLAVDEISEGDGDLTRVVDVHSKDEAGILAKSINKFIHNLKDMIINIKTVSASSSHMSEVLAANSEEISSTVVEVTSTMQSINDKTENLSNEIHKSEDSVAYIRKMILELNKNVEKENEFLSNSSAAIEEMVASIISVTKISQDKKEAIDDLNRIASVGEEDMESTIKSIRDISNSVDAMTDMIDVITNVSEQINILSMNAAIEAAHAGEAGKGFAVVADEIRKLAETTSNNTTAMSKSLKDIIKGITDADKKSTNTGETIKTIMGEIRSVSTSLSEVILSLSEISAGTNQITTTLSGLIETSGDVQQTSVKMDKESVIIEETFKHVTSLSLQNKNGIDEITTGLSGISEALTELSEESTKNYENTSLLNSVVHKFITEK